MNSVASQIRLTSNEPQQKGIHCNTVPTDKFLTFDKTKYGQYMTVSQIKENEEQNIICNKCHNAICTESLVTCLTCMKMVKKCILLTGKEHTRHGKITENQLLHMQKLPCTTATKMTCVCCNRYMQKHVYQMYKKVDYDFTNFVVSQCL